MYLKYQADHLNESTRESIFKEKFLIFKLSGGSYFNKLKTLNLRQNLNKIIQ
jgi:hypothetical protein